MQISMHVDLETFFYVSTKHVGRYHRKLWPWLVLFVVRAKAIQSNTYNNYPRSKQASTCQTVIHLSLKFKQF